MRKEAKKKGISKRVKKDIGVPNSAPFKEEILREAEQRKLQVSVLAHTVEIPNPYEMQCNRGLLDKGNKGDHCFFPKQLEELKEQNRIAKRNEKAQKRKQEKEAAKADTEPKAKKQKKVTKHHIKHLKSMNIFFCRFSQPTVTIFFLQDKKTKQQPKQSTGTDRSSKRFRCRELNKVSCSQMVKQC